MIGEHILLDLGGVESTLLDDKDALIHLLVGAAGEAQMTVLGVLGHAFDPQGVTAIVLLAESHMSIHTYPEFGYAALDVFTCGDGSKSQIAARHIIDHLEPKIIKSRTELRGLGESFNDPF